MAARVFLVTAVVLFCFAQVLSDFDIEIDEDLPYLQQVEVRGGNRRLMQVIDCGAQCTRRCSLHSRPNVCMRACGTCCGRCRCVPPGTYGNREVCGKCYTDMTTHGNKTKCP